MKNLILLVALVFTVSSFAGQKKIISTENNSSIVFTYTNNEESLVIEYCDDFANCNNLFLGSTEKFAAGVQAELEVIKSHKVISKREVIETTTLCLAIGTATLFSSSNLSLMIGAGLAVITAVAHPVSNMITKSTHKVEETEKVCELISENSDAVEVEQVEDYVKVINRVVKRISESY